MKETQVNLDEFFYAWKVLRENVGEYPSVLAGRAVTSLLRSQIEFIPVHAYEKFGIKRKPKENEIGTCFGKIIIADDNIKDWGFKFSEI